MSSNQSSKKEQVKDYDKEINDIFAEALKEIDPELMETLRLVSSMHQQETQSFDIVNSFTGTVESKVLHAQ